jgi:hypothetical protein
MPESHRAEALNAQEMRLKSYQHTTRANGRKASENARYRKSGLSHRAEEQDSHASEQTPILIFICPFYNLQELRHNVRLH